MIFDVPPTVEQLKEMLNLIGLVGALILTMVAPLPMSYGFGDYIEAVERRGGDFADYDDARAALDYEEFVWDWNASFAALTASLLAVVFLLASVGHTSFRGPDGKPSAPMLRNCLS